MFISTNTILGKTIQWVAVMVIGGFLAVGVAQQASDAFNKGVAPIVQALDKANSALK